MQRPVCLVSGQNPTGQNPTGQYPYGQNPTGQNPTGQNPTTWKVDKIPQYENLTRRYWQTLLCRRAIFRQLFQQDVGHWDVPTCSAGSVPLWRIPLWRMPVWRIRYGACQTGAGPVWRRTSTAHFTMAQLQYDAFQYGAFHYDAGPVLRISVWRIPVCRSSRPDQCVVVSPSCQNGVCILFR